jgi:hypothetical protein
MKQDTVHFNSVTYVNGRDEKLVKFLLKNLVGRPWRRWEDNIKINLGEIGWEGLDWIHLAQDTDIWRAVVNKVMDIKVP